MRLVYGFLCDYAAAGASNKPTAVGIFDAIFAKGGDKPTLPGCFIHAQFDAPGSGPRRVLTLMLVDDDGKALEENELNISLAPGADGLGMGAYLYLFMPGKVLPDFGDYEFVLSADGVRFASIPLRAREIREGQIVKA